MENQELKDLLDRYLQRKASPEEVERLLAYFHIEKESKQLLDIINAEINKPFAEDNIRDLHEHALYTRVESKLAERIDAEQERKIFSIGFSRFMRIAVPVAACLIVIIGAYVWLRPATAVMKTVYAAYGKRIEITLPDSSHVWLNGGTTLQYPEVFSKGQREITLKDGDIFFDITHIDNSPFIVHTKGNDVQVLGTSFEISAFAKDRNTKVSVLTGKVGVLQADKKNAATFLLPGEQAIINHATHLIQKSKINIQDIAAWRNGRLIFEDQPFAEVINSLERTYNVQIQIDNDNLLNEKVTMRLNHQPLMNVLTAISFSHHFSFRKINDQLIIVK